jgi:hypothetical protein
MLNSNGMDVIYNEGQTLTWKMTGGIFDMFIFLARATNFFFSQSNFFFFKGATPEKVVQQYTQLIGFSEINFK